jgi:hypothetical protein
MIREPWVACAAFPGSCLHESRKGEYNDRQQANCRQENRSACGVKLGRHRGYARLVRFRRSSSEQRLSPLSSAALRELQRRDREAGEGGPGPIGRPCGS